MYHRLQPRFSTLRFRLELNKLFENRECLPFHGSQRNNRCSDPKSRPSSRYGTELLSTAICSSPPEYCEACTGHTEAVASLPIDILYGTQGDSNGNSVHEGGEQIRLLVLSTLEQWIAAKSVEYQAKRRPSAARRGYV
jgi:hypothetical protein